MIDIVNFQPQSLYFLLIFVPTSIYVVKIFLERRNLIVDLPTILVSCDSSEDLVVFFIRDVWN